MKKYLILLSLVFFSFSNLWAHCPSAYKEENVCFMLDDNLLYIYDHKAEHNGPYKDLQKATLAGLKDAKGAKLQYKKIARGVYKIETTQLIEPKEKYRNIILEISLDKKITTVNVSAEK